MTYLPQSAVLDNEITSGTEKSGSFANFLKVVDSIIEISVFETEELKQNKRFDIAMINMRKARLLMDFSSASKDVQINSLPPEIIARLKTMQLALRRSVRQYRFHTIAISEIADLIMQAARAQESDGTYSVQRTR